MEGFLVDVWCVSEANLEVEVDASALGWHEYRALVEELEDILSYIDERHSVRPELVHGRGLKARYKRVTAEDRRRKLRFSPFPSVYSNVLKHTRHYVYDALSEDCLVLEKVGRRKVYFLPKELAPAFIESIDRLNKEFIEPLRKKIDDFRNSDDYLNIGRCLSAHGIDPTVLKVKSFHISEYVMDVIPVNFGYSVDADEFYAKAERLKATAGLEALRREVERKRRQYLAGALSDVTRRILDVAERLEDRKILFAYRKVEKLIGICRSLGLDEVNERVLKPLLEISKAKGLAKKAVLSEKHFGTTNIKEGVTKALNEVLPK